VIKIVMRLTSRFPSPNIRANFVAFVPQVR
jgi:hypothetical protein